MTHIATMGTSSCATIAIGNFGKYPKPNAEIERNQAYLADPTSVKIEGMTVGEFYSKILYPTDQPLGTTAEYPFDLLMEELEKSRMNDKFTIITLNEDQNTVPHWQERLAHWGFFLIDQTKNNIGTMNYIYTRNRARPKKV
jgi:hypothetical protein